jgi:hypothetical protein
VQARLNLEHEFVEVHAALLRDRSVGKEQVHEHGLAAAHRAPDVEAMRALRRLRREPEPREKALLLRRRGRHRGKLIVDRLQPGDDLFLHGIGVDFAGGTARGKVGHRALAGRGGTALHCGGIPSSPAPGCL